MKPEWRCRDHPRVCGEKQMLQQAGRVWVGSPPHMRGKETMLGCAVGAHRITPAYAEKSWSAHSLVSSLKDHPRVCGEKTHYAMKVPPW